MKGSGLGCRAVLELSSADPEKKRKKFEVRLRALVIEVHPDPEVERLEVAKIEGTDYVAVVPKGQFKTGDKALYIPEAAVVPKEILQEMNLWGMERVNKESGEVKVIGKLAGPEGNRVKAMKLRGVLSQGLVYSPSSESRFHGLLKDSSDEDLSEALGVYKYRPPIPPNMDSEIEVSEAIKPYTDIENIKNWPQVFKEGEEVIASEKAHGSCTIITHDGPDLELSSKGRAQQGLVLKRNPDPQGIEQNLYWRVAERFGLQKTLISISKEYGGEQVSLYGESYGDVQDLKYGLSKSEVDFKVFDIRIGDRYLDYAEFKEVADRHNLPCVPLLYKGPYSKEAIEEVTSGPEQVSGTEAHLREGVVVKPIREREDPELGRVILKSISPDYLTRKGKKGQEVTEYE